MNKYTNEERAEMILLYGECKKNAKKALSLYKTRFPDRTEPTRGTFRNLYETLRKLGRFQHVKPVVKVPLPHYIAHKIVKKKNTYNFCETSDDDSDGSPSNVIHVLNFHKFHPYYMSMHQELQMEDCIKRVQFCKWGMQHDDDFLRKILFTNEVTFTNHGQVNTWNMHYWSAKNPHWIQQVEHRSQWSVNVWCGIIDDYIIGPYFIDGSLTINKYVSFLKEILCNLLEKVPLEIRKVMWYQRDECPVYNAVISLQTLNELFPIRWIGPGGFVDWPPLSSDLNPVDFFLWGKIKSMVYENVPTTPGDMQQRIKRACETIKPNILRAIRYSFKQRMKKCRDQLGHDFQHLL